MMFLSSMYLLKQKPCLLVMHIHISVRNFNFITNNLKQGWLNAADQKWWVMYYLIYFLMKKNYITKQFFFSHSFFNCAIYMFPIKLLTYKYPYVFSLHRWSRTEAWKSCLRLSMENRFCTSECINVKCWERDFSLIQLITKSTWSTLYMSMRKAVSTAELFNQLWEKTAAGHEPLCVSRLYCDGPS